MPPVSGANFTVERCSMTILLYDIPSTFPEKTYSSNTWKVRFALNLKGLPHKTQWVEMPDIEPLYKTLGIAAVAKQADGTPFYTLPVIHDPATGASVADSLLIAEYLEKRYPDTPSLFPHNTLPLQAAFVDVFDSTVAPVTNFTYPLAFLKVNSPTSAFLSRTKEPLLGKSIEEILPRGKQAIVEWEKVREGWNKLDGWFAKNGGNGPFFLGNTFSWADFVVVSYLLYMKIVFGEGSQKWKDVITWHEGRWKKLLEELEEYSTIIL